MGAESLVIYNGNGSRAGEGNFVKSGLYKIDKDGNVSAVGIFAKEDGSTREERLDVIPEGGVWSIGDNYIFLYWCNLYETGNPYSVGPYKNLMVDKRTGNIYDMTQTEMTNGAEISSNKLVGWGGDPLKVGKIDVYGDKAIFNEINSNGHGFYGAQSNPNGLYPNMNELKSFVKELDNGTILSQAAGELRNWTGAFYDVAILYPNGGYDYLKDMLNREIGIGNKDFSGMILNNGCAALVCDFSQQVSQWYNISIGSKSGDYKIELTDEINDYLNLHDITYYEGEQYVIVSLESSYLIYDKTSKKINKFTPSFTEQMYIDPDCYFKGKIWDLYTGGGASGVKALWIDPSTLKSGSFDLNLDGVDVTKIEPYYSTGKIVIYGISRSDGSSVVATADLETETTEIIFTPREENTITLIPLN